MSNYVERINSLIGSNVKKTSYSVNGNGKKSIVPKINSILGSGSTWVPENILGMAKLNPNTPCMNGTSDVCIGRQEAFALKQKLGLKSNKIQDISRESKEKLGCNDELCVVNSITDEYPNVKLLFKAKGPLNPNSPLDSEVIDMVLSRMEYNYDGFVACNWAYRDFDTNEKYMSNEFNKLHNTNLVSILKNKYYHSLTSKKGGNYFACVINTDKYQGRGIHWVCVVADMREQPFKLMYFNSLAKDDPDKSAITTYDNIKNWLELQQKYLAAENYKSEVIMVDNIMHQKENVVCGLYVLFFILSIYNKVPLEVFTQTEVDDELMAVPFRNAIFA
jgi:hypothetical protein